MKKIIFSILILIFVVIIYSLLTEKEVEFVHLNTCPDISSEAVYDIRLINSKEDYLYDKLNLNDYNIDFTKSTVVISKGEIDRINLVKKYKFLPFYTHFIKVHLKNVDNNKINIYVLPKNHVYFDERLDAKCYIIAEK